MPPSFHPNPKDMSIPIQKKKKAYMFKEKKNGGKASLILSQQFSVEDTVTKTQP